VRRSARNITHVPYKGGSPSVLAIMSGEAQVNFATLPAVVPQIRGGKVRAIGLASQERNPAVPEVPTMAELGLADFDVGTWSGLVGPKGCRRRGAEDQRGGADVVNDPAIQQAPRRRRRRDPPHVARGVRRLHAHRERRWVKVVKDAGIQPQ
jgi:tripartite-type tricarboxylate transporter receptor subunit TctC